jgi:hypothetical protein
MKNVGRVLMGLWMGWGVASAIKTGLPTRVSGVVVVAGVLVGGWTVLGQGWQWWIQRRQRAARQP